MPFLLSEEAALKGKLQGITVSDLRNPSRPVRVFYGMPDPEIREAAYPFITIDLVGISEAVERAHRGLIRLPYVPEGHPTPIEGFTGPLTEFPIPLNIDYQITSWARFPQHDRQIIGSLFQLVRTPHRFGFLLEPVEGTIRRLDFLSFNVGDRYDDNNKRLFRKIFTIRISAELMASEINNLRNVNKVVTTVTNRDTGVSEFVVQDKPLPPKE